MLHHNLMQNLRTLLVFSILCFAATSFAQGYRGSDFWICFPKNAIYEQGQGAALIQTLYIASDYRTSGEIKPMDGGKSIFFDVEAGASISIDLDSTYELTS